MSVRCRRRRQARPLDHRLRCATPAGGRSLSWPPTTRRSPVAKKSRKRRARKKKSANHGKRPTAR
ncbi:MAG: hypothetical protein GEV12_18560 [Micromonosporaceae bacterium]|nr:hypothetical protein [Micromonosporaceae bacterium]